MEMEIEVAEVEVMSETSQEKGDKMEIDLGAPIKDKTKKTDSKSRNGTSKTSNGTPDKAKTKKKNPASVTSSTSTVPRNVRAVSEAPSDANTASSQYNVERILDRRTVKGKLQYLIKWEGYSTSDNSWEPVENIYCVELVKAFDEKLKARAKQKADTMFPKRGEKKPEMKSNTKKIRQLYSSSESDDDYYEAKKKKKHEVHMGSKKSNLHDTKPKAPLKMLGSHSTKPSSSAAPNKIKIEGQGSKDTHETKKVPPKRTDVDVHKFLGKRNLAITQAGLKSGFDRGYELEEIIGMGKTTAGRQFLVKWKGVAELELIPSSICNKRCPQRVIKFYEQRTHFASDSENSSFDEFCVSDH